MKITHVTTRVLRTPADNPLVVGLPAPTPALKAAVDALARLVVGDAPTQVEAVGARLRRAASSSGPGGIFSLALSVVAVSLRKIQGKAVGRSVCALMSG